MLKEKHLALLTDFYELTMSNGYFNLGKKDTICIFDVFFRDVPDKGGYAIACGINSVVDYLLNFKFSKDEIGFLEEKKLFSSDFLDYLKDFHFSGDVYAVKEGEVVFPGEPIITIKAKAIEAQLIETYILLCINHQSLIATKTSRIVKAAKGRPVMEFGARRSHGSVSSILGARASYVAGAKSTSNTLTDFYFEVPASGTMAHSWIEMFPNEYEAFMAYAKLYPNGAVLLIDTYDVLKSGLPNAIKVFKELNLVKGGIRIDSGDLTYLSKKVRKKLDEEGLKEIKIVVSNSLDEFIITELLDQGAPIDSFGVGERLITAKSDPVFGAVYKLAALEVDDKIIPKIKISDSVGKITNPGFKKVYRLIDLDSKKAIADLITLREESLEGLKEIEIFDPLATWKRKTITNFIYREVTPLIIKDGKLLRKLATLKQSRDYCEKVLKEQWDEVKRLVNPHGYYVDLSEKLYNLKQELLKRKY
ncbi:MAG: nicotinate phosphoribosyltransferase [Bacillales bacterium]|jgi:nicotinate phosphoribosyltransferase|nr:nicotinate phosphoribosyltransferase [Bacillales bacterium]